MLGRFAEFAEGADDKFLMAVVANLPGGVRLELYDFDQALKTASGLTRPRAECRDGPNLAATRSPKPASPTSGWAISILQIDSSSVRRSCSKTKTSLSAGVGRWYCCAAAGNWPWLADSATKHGDSQPSLQRPRE